MKTWAFLSAVAATLLAGAAVQAAEPKIGVYYFPGWSNDPFNEADSWKRIRAFPEREPLLGWYAGSARATLQKQADMMQAAHLDFVAFDWYYAHGKPQLQGPLDAYLTLTTPRPKLSLLWDNHGHPSAADWHAIVDIWAGYFAKAPFYQVGGANVIFVVDAQRFANDATAAGANAAAWTGYAQSEMKRRGLPPIYFVAGVYSGDDTILHSAIADGFASFSAYNMHQRPGINVNVKGYANLDSAYRAQWERMARFGNTIKPILPLTSGWDHRPWGPTPDRDGSIATPAEFKAHLEAARAFMIAKQINSGVICCWNEYGEGSFIEPTKQRGKALVNAIRATFPR
jgi:hypothetical protein